MDQYVILGIIEVKLSETIPDINLKIHLEFKSYLISLTENNSSSYQPEIFVSSFSTPKKTYKINLNFLSRKKIVSLADPVKQSFEL